MSTIQEMKPTGEIGLPELATRIKTLHGDVIGAGKTIIQKAMEAGDALIRAKRNPVMKHGEWLPWLKENCGVSERRAQHYMKLAANRSKIEAAMKNEPGADFSLKWALGQLKETDGDGGDGVLGQYEKAHTALIKRLRALDADDVQAAVERTITELNAVVGAMKPAKAA
jgi:hypothetical protein